MYDNIHEGQYLIKLLASAVNNSPVTPPPEALNWEKLYHLASFHSVANTAYYSLLKFPEPSIVPDDIWNKFSLAAKKFSAQEALQHFEIRQILLRFERNHAFCVPLKGHVMKGLYPRPDMRYMSSVDLLVNEKDISIIHSIMVSLGYTLIRSAKNSFSYFKTPSISIDLCTSLMPSDNELYDYFEKVRQNVTPKKGLHYIYAMSKEDFYIYTLTCLAQHYAAGGTGIRSILDIWVFLKHYGPVLNRELIAMELDKFNLGLFSFYIEELAWIWFSGGKSFSDKHLYQEMESYIFSGSVGGDIHQPFEAFTASTQGDSSYANIEGSSGPAGEDKQRLFPNLEIMSARYPILVKMPFLLPVFWLVRLAGSLLPRHLKSSKQPSDRDKS